MTNPTLERAARALCEAMGEDWDNESPAWKSIHLSRARAVLMAVRSPDDRMDNAGVEAANGVMEGWVDEGQVGFVWQAMIDAILADGGE